MSPCAENLTVSFTGVININDIRAFELFSDEIFSQLSTQITQTLLKRLISKLKLKLKLNFPLRRLFNPLIIPNTFFRSLTTAEPQYALSTIPANYLRFVRT